MGSLAVDGAFFGVAFSWFAAWTSMDPCGLVMFPIEPLIS